MTYEIGDKIWIHTESDGIELMIPGVVEKVGSNGSIGVSFVLFGRKCWRNRMLRDKISKRE